MMLDIDRFKSINDEHGHSLGDAVLKNLAERIQSGIRETDFAVRFGGDEILIVLSDTASHSAQQVVNRIIDELSEMHDYSFPVTVSTGYTLRSECESRTGLIALADQRMYEDKKRRYPTA
jgi:diguanylate cyclase (GGDEF)-like protein